MIGQVINLESDAWNAEERSRRTAQKPIGWRPHHDKMQYLAESVAAWADVDATVPSGYNSDVGRGTTQDDEEEAGVGHRKRLARPDGNDDKQQTTTTAPSRTLAGETKDTPRKGRLQYAVRANSLKQGGWGKRTWPRT